MRVGKRAWLEREGVHIPDDLEQAAIGMLEGGATVIWVAADDRAVGVLALADPIKETTKEAVQTLHELGLKLVMLTGDHHTTAHAIARQLSRAVMRNIRQNLFFAFVYNALGVPVAAGVLYPFVGWLLDPMLAAAAMSLSSASVIGNALRLRRVEV